MPISAATKKGRPKPPLKGLFGQRLLSRLQALGFAFGQGQAKLGCESAWKIDPLTGDIGVQK
jgi:hypothetical protein